VKPTVLGASGKTGRYVVEQALAAGDDMTVGAYRTGHLRPGPRHSVSRADLAAFMLRLAAGREFVRRASRVSH
jgi:uncharacterized protein YbjT (DUF2867 family)